MRHVLCLLVYVSPCLDVGLFMLYLFYLLFFFTFIIINHIISLKQTNRHTCFFAYFCLNFTQFFCQFQRGRAYKSVAYTKKAYAAYLNSSKHRKSWFVNFSSYLHYYLQHFSKHVCLSHNSQSIDQNYQRQHCNEA